MHAGTAQGTQARSLRQVAKKSNERLEDGCLGWTQAVKLCVGDDDPAKDVLQQLCIEMTCAEMQPKNRDVGAKVPLVGRWDTAFDSIHRYGKSGPKYGR